MTTVLSGEISISNDDIFEKVLLNKSALFAEQIKLFSQTKNRISDGNQSPERS